MSAPDDVGDRRSIPEGWRVGRLTPTFSAESVPPGLLADHRTSVWARLEVEAGAVRFLETETGFEAVAEAGSPVVIVPDRGHRIEPSADARFAVRFFDPTPGAP